MQVLAEEAVERGDHRDQGDVDGEEEHDECCLAFCAFPGADDEAPDDDRCDDERHDGEIEPEIRELVDGVSADIERWVSTP